MDAFMDPTLEMIVFCCAAQMGKTELIFAVIGKTMTDGPRSPCMYLGPTEKQVRSVSKQRISQMIASTPALDELHQKGRYDSIGEKYFAGGVRLGFAHAGSATEVASHPCGLVMVDEYSRMEPGPEGDPMLLAKARTKNYPGGKVGIFSTPTVLRECPTWNWFLEGTREMWCWRCLHCEDWFAPRRSYLSWPDGCTPGEARLSAVVACPHCGGAIRTQDRAQLDGRYIPHDIDDDGNWVAAEREPEGVVRSFWASGLASPWRTFGQIAEQLARASELGDASLQTIVNTDLGEPFEMTGDAPDWSEVREHALPYELGEVPDGCQMLTMGVDVQKRGLYWVIRGFGYAGSSWLIDRGTILGETAYDTPWIALTQLHQREWGGMPVRRVFIDSGYRPGEKYARPKHRVYEYAKGFAHVFPTKGQDQMDKAVNASLQDVTTRGKVLRSGVRLWNINTHYWKTWVYNHIRMDKGAPEAFHVPEEIDEEYCRQVTAEELVIEERRFRWIPHYRHNHYLDCEVLAVAAAHTIGMEKLGPPEEKKAAAVNRGKIPPRPKPSPGDGFSPRDL